MLAFHREHRRQFEWRESTEPYAVLIGEVLLQRTRAEQAREVYRGFMARWPDPNALAAASRPEIESVIAPLGLRKRAGVLERLAQALVDLGAVPVKPEQLASLPGVGPYAAHAVPIFSRNRNLPLVDWVIARVLRRYFGLAHGRRPNSDTELWTLATVVAKAGRAREVWLGTLDLAAGVCKRRPLCSECPLRRDCSYASRSTDRA